MRLVVKIFKDFGNFKLDINFDSSEKNIAFLGSSGCGKSLTLKCIAGIIKPDRGYIELNGRVLFDSEKKINLPPQKRRVGYLFQNYALFPNMTIRKNIMCGLSQEKDKNVKNELVDHYLDVFELHNVANNYPREISGGQAQRVALARILVSSPEIILLDEPFSALDSFLRNKMEIEVKEILKNYQGQAVLVSHSRDEIYLLSDETIVISNGKNLIKSNTKDLFINPVYLEASILTGCKNHSRIASEDGFIIATDWGIKIEKKADTNYKYIGIRAHQFALTGDSNSAYKIKIIDIIEEPFENSVRFKYINQTPESEPLIWKVDKQAKIDKNIDTIYFDKKDVMLLL